MAEVTNKANIFDTYRNDSGAFLQRIRSALNARTSIKQIGARGQAVRLFYQSGAHVDIAPVFKWSSSGYALPSGSGGWITTDPEEQASWYSTRRDQAGSHLTPVVRLCKRWNNVHSHRLASFHLEVMIASMFANVPGSWREAMRDFFTNAPNWLGVSDPAGHSGRLDDYLTYAEREALKSRLSEALNRATRAISEETVGNHSEAKRLWKIEMGDEFPTS